MSESQLTKSQFKRLSKDVENLEGYGRARVVVTIRYDDECGNGHNTFAITGEVYQIKGPGTGVRGRELLACGCIHGIIAEVFPELREALPFHLCASDGPMHYVANTKWHAGNRDCWGLLEGEFRQHTSRGKYQADGVEGVPCWELEKPEATEIYAHDLPASVTLRWKPYGRTGEGKERELDAARAAAIWPDATDEELTEPGLEERLTARLPALLERFRAIVEGFGFTW